MAPCLSGVRVHVEEWRRHQAVVCPPLHRTLLRVLQQDPFVCSLARVSRKLLMLHCEALPAAPLFETTAIKHGRVVDAV
jgi:hypothetical protein